MLRPQYKKRDGVGALLAAPAMKERDGQARPLQIIFVSFVLFVVNNLGDDVDRPADQINVNRKFIYSFKNEVRTLSG